LFFRGLALFENADFEGAERVFQESLKLAPNRASTLSNLAWTQVKLSKYEEAKTNAQAAVSVERENGALWYALGFICVCQQQFVEALEHLERAISLQPNFAEAHVLRGRVLLNMQRIEEALECYDRAIELQPDLAEAYNNRGAILRNMQYFDEAYYDFEKAIEINPDFAASYNNRGNNLVDLDRLEDALASFDRALELKPDYAEAYSNRGNCLRLLRRLDKAIASYDQAIALRPEAEFEENKALALLLAGDFEKGWQLNESRWKRGNVQNVFAFGRPLWLGDENIAGKRIFIHHEQGFGDTIHFIRYIPQLAALGAHVIVTVQPALKTLVSSVEGASVVLGDEEPPPFDCQCPLLSLPLAFKTRLETIPAKVPYLSVSAERMNVWKGRLPDTEKPRIALAWAGNSQFRGDRRRSIGLAALAPLLSVPDVQFISIQKDLREGDDDILRNHPELVVLGPELRDFSDTAAVMSQVDLVISSDTAVVHLAGALGRPVWMLLEYVPDWRWMIDREDSPWYPTARLFRQRRAGDWEGVVASVSDELQRFERASPQLVS
jgi:tetratricopeptide (TPR) repeat protein